MVIKGFGDLMERSKKALITGITGQDGSYLSEFLLSQGYEVYGVKRRSSSFNTDGLITYFRIFILKMQDLYYITVT